MKLRSSFDNYSFSSNKLTGLLVTLSLFLALSGNTEKVIAQEKDKQAQSVSLKDKYFTQLLSEIQKEMKLEEDKKILEKNKESAKNILKEFRNETCFLKEKKEEVLDSHLEKLLNEMNSVKSASQFSSVLDKIIVFVGGLKQKTVVIGQEKISAGPKEISYEIVDTYIARLAALKTLLSKNQEQQKSLDLLSMPSIALLLQQAKEAITKKESEYNNQLNINDSLKQDYTKFVQYVYGLEKNITSLSTQIQEKNIQLEIDQKEFSTFEALGTNVDEKDFAKKVELVNSVSSLKKDIETLTDSLNKSNANLVVDSNKLPVKEVDIDQNIRKLGTIQKGLLDEKTKQYNQISDSFKRESKTTIDAQDKEIEKQMAILKKSIDSYNFGIDSLNNVLQKINEEIETKFGSGENVIKQREINIQRLLKEHVKYSQELEKLYLMYKSVLSQNKEAIIKLEKDNPFITIDISELESEKQDMERIIESLRVNIDAKEKEKIETKDDSRVISIINELTVLYTNLQRSQTAFRQIEDLLKQRKFFDSNYSKKKDKEVDQIDKAIEYLDNNISASKHAIGSFVYGYYMQLKKMEIQNVSIKTNDIEKRINETNNKIVGLQNLEKEKRNLIKKTTGSPSERLHKEKQLLVDINIINANINSLKSALTKDTKLLEEYKNLLIELEKIFKEFASLAKEDLDAYLDFSFNGLSLKDGLKNNNYPLPKRLPIDISDFASIEKLIQYIKEAGFKCDFSIDDIKNLYK